MWRLVGRRAWLRIHRNLWRELIRSLGERADGRRESGAFLCADRSARRSRVTRVVYYDDLDPTSLNGGVSFAFAGYGSLWDVCEKDQLRVIGDVHTHPGSHVRQSSTDQANPMVARVGHIALIVPHLAGRPLSAEEVGVHRYIGEDGWQSRYGKQAARDLYVGRWP
jgi:proteasome lid subunit RPN8/RPN11